MISFSVLVAMLCLADGSPAPRGGYGGYSSQRVYSGSGWSSYSRPKKCVKEVDTITRKWCKLEYEESCTTETKPFTKITGYEKGECKDIEYCKPRYSGHHGYRGKRSPGYGSTTCEKVVKEVCKQVPVKEEASRQVEKCTRTPKEVRRRHNQHIKVILTYVSGL